MKKATAISAFEWATHIDFEGTNVAINAWRHLNRRRVDLYESLTGEIFSHRANCLVPDLEICSPSGKG